jgi:Tfp pilus assembly protein PilF
MSRYFFIFFFGIITESIIAQTNDSVSFYLNNYNYSKVIDLLKDKSNKTTIDYNTLGTCHLKLGNNLLAKKEFDEALAIDSTNRNALYNLGKLFFSAENLIASKYYWEKLYQTDSNNLFYLKLLAKVNSTLQDYDTAIPQFKAIIKKNPDDLKSLLSLAQIYFSKKEYNIADTLLSTYKNRFIGNKNFLYLLIKTKYLLNSYQAALSLTDTYLSNFQSNTVIEKIRGMSFYHMEKFDSTIQCLKRIDDYEKNHTLCYYIGVSYYKSERQQEAQKFLSLAITNSQPKDLASYYSYLAFSYDLTRNYALAIKNLKKSYDLSPQKTILFFLASEYDKYYKDKKVAARFYRRYLAENDTVNLKLVKYSRYRLETITEKLHFLNDSL